MDGWLNFSSLRGGVLVRICDTRRCVAVIEFQEFRCMRVEKVQIYILYFTEHRGFMRYGTVSTHFGCSLAQIPDPPQPCRRPPVSATRWLFPSQ